MISPETLGMAYGKMAMYDKLPEAAQRHFHDIRFDPEKIREKAQRLIDSASKDERLEVGMAGNFAYVEALFYVGKMQYARRYLEELTKDSTLSALNLILLPLDTSYAEICCKHQSLVTPSRLDEIVFDEFAPESNQPSEYWNKNGLSLIYRKSDGSVYIGFVSQELELINVESEKGTRGRIIVRTHPAKILRIAEPYAPPEEIVQQVFHKTGINSYGIVRANTEKIMPYLEFRFFIQTVGKIVKENTLLGDIRITEEDSDLDFFNRR